MYSPRELFEQLCTVTRKSKILDEPDWFKARRLKERIFTITQNGIILGGKLPGNTKRTITVRKYNSSLPKTVVYCLDQFVQEQPQDQPKIKLKKLFINKF